MKESRQVSNFYKTVHQVNIHNILGQGALNLSDNWNNLGMLTKNQVENSNFEQKCMLWFNCLTNINNVNTSYPL